MCTFDYLARIILYCGHCGNRCYSQKFRTIWRLHIPPFSVGNGLKCCNYGKGAFDGTCIDLYPNKKQQLQKEFNSIPNTTPLKNGKILS
jgi:hypothetical protein